MDSLEQISVAGMPELRAEPAGLGPAGGTLSAAEQARAERRAARLAVVAKALEATGRAVDRMVAYMHGELTEAEAKPLEWIADPANALVKLDRAVRQIAALADRL